MEPVRRHRAFPSLGAKHADICVSQPPIIGRAAPSPLGADDSDKLPRPAIGRGFFTGQCGATSGGNLQLSSRPECPRLEILLPRSDCGSQGPRAMVEKAPP